MAGFGSATSRPGLSQCRYTPRMNELRVYDRVSEIVGWTPMVRLHRSVEGLDREVLAKLEYLNPMGSVKDRIARHMIEEAMQAGDLQAGDVIVESSSGYTGMGLARMAVLQDW